MANHVTIFDITLGISVKNNLTLFEIVCNKIVNDITFLTSGLIFSWNEGTWLLNGKIEYNKSLNIIVSVLRKNDMFYLAKIKEIIKESIKEANLPIKHVQVFEHEARTHHFICTKSI